jgi:hypothetical protein
MEDKAIPNAKTVLNHSFNDLYLNLNNFSEKILGVKTPFQLMHLMRHVFNEHLAGKQIGRDSQVKPNFSEYDEKQNRGLYALKTLV